MNFKNNKKKMFFIYFNLINKWLYILMYVYMYFIYAVGTIIMK